MKPLAFPILAVALAATAARARETIAISDLRFRGHGAAAAELTERVRETVQRSAPGTPLVETAEEADLNLTGSVTRGGMGYQATLELRDRTGMIVQRATATATTRRELAEAIEGATADVIRRWGTPPDGTAIAVAAGRRADVRAPPEAPPADGGPEPDAAQLREILPLASVAEPAKIEMLIRFARAYGFDKLSPLVALLPTREMREHAELSLDCEVKEAQACVQLGRGADDAKAALRYLDRACAAGAAEVCADVGDRWLAADPRDAARGIAALQAGCDAGSPASCVRLARMYEEADGVPVNASAATEARGKACLAGDGRSCRRLAGVSDDPGRVADLLRKGCDGGDSVSCALAQSEPAIVRRQLQEAGARPHAIRTNARPAIATDGSKAELSRSGYFK